MLTNKMAHKKVDKHGGKLCCNSLQLAQMATMSNPVYMLAGAFVIPNSVTGSVNWGPRYWCPWRLRFLLFSEEYGKEFLDGISLDEQMRPAKI
jgi:hypothetical protein